MERNYTAETVRNDTLAARIKRALGGVPTLVLDVRHADGVRVAARAERLRASLAECRKIGGEVR